MKAWSAGEHVNYTDLNGNFNTLKAEADEALLHNQVSLTAGENLTQGDAVIIGSASHIINIDQMGGSRENENFTDTFWRAVTIVSSAKARTISRVVVPLSKGTGAPDKTVTCKIRSSLTGADLASESVNMSGDGFQNVTFNFSTPATVTPSTTYYVVLVGPASFGIVWKDANGGSCNTSSDSGATWGTDAYTMNLEVYEQQTEAGKVYKADASSDDEYANNFIGFADDDITSGDAGIIDVGGVIDILSGLTAGAQYFLSDTAGAIAETAGTKSREIGNALSATKLLIKHDNS